jgi:thiol-disulfide isomerase/thioredoxin
MNLPLRLILALLYTGLFAAAAAAETPAAPEWTLQDPDGREVSSKQFAGKLVVVDFWATWCGPCVEEIPGYVALQKKYGKDGLVIVGVSLDRGGPAKVKRFMAEHGMNYVVVMGNAEIGDAFGGFEAIPTTFLVSRDGRIVHRKTGAWEHAKYEELVRKHL